MGVATFKDKIFIISLVTKDPWQLLIALRLYMYCIGQLCIMDYYLAHAQWAGAGVGQSKIV